MRKKYTINRLSHLGKIIDSDVIFLNETVATNEKLPSKGSTQKLLPKLFSLTDSSQPGNLDREKLGVDRSSNLGAIGAAIPHSFTNQQFKGKHIINL